MNLFPGFLSSSGCEVISNRHRTTRRSAGGTNLRSELLYRSRSGRLICCTRQTHMTLPCRLLTERKLSRSVVAASVNQMLTACKAAAVPCKAPALPLRSRWNTSSSSSCSGGSSVRAQSWVSTAHHTWILWTLDRGYSRGALGIHVGVVVVSCRRWRRWRPCDARARCPLNPWWALLGSRCSSTMLTNCPHTSVSDVHCFFLYLSSHRQVLETHVFFWHDPGKPASVDEFFLFVFAVPVLFLHFF